MLRVHLLPGMVSPDELAGAVVVVIDVLRATTTICHVLAAGASEVLPCLEVEQARQIAASLLRAGRSGRNLGEIGLGDDIAVASRIDLFDLVPEARAGGEKIGLW